MAQVVVRNLEEYVKKSLQRRAKLHGHSMEEEIRNILRNSVKEKKETKPFGLGTQIANLFKGTGLDFEIPEMKGQKPRPATFK